MKNQAATLNQHKSSHLGWFVSSDRIKNEVSQSKPGLSTDVLASDNDAFLLFSAVLNRLRRGMLIKKRHVKILLIDQRLYNICISGICH
ncbi:hypothetical protein HID58_019105 [Brassica napus]|uniref:Uncharacterized protein n=1 Tax=Brassica napus TaxID=3708 RepID=A0ABQ8DBV8_BRANA|nr:hypothetical protein HID58_019105 [Brassica napus]